MEIIHPGEVDGEVMAPPSKSYTHRALFLALLADSPSRIMGKLQSQDTLRSMEAIKRFGAVLKGDKVYPPQELSPGKIFAGESGTTARISLAVAALPQGRSVIDGRGRLRVRPMYPLVKALEDLEVKIEGKFLPIAVDGGVNKSVELVKVDASQSSQFVTAMLILASRLGFAVEYENAVSRPYIEVTLKTIENFHVKYRREESRIYVEPGIKGTTLYIPGDYSSASFFLAAGALFGRVRVRNLKVGDKQADAAILDILRDYGAEVKIFEDSIQVERGERHALHVDCTDYPDLFPILTVLAAYAPGRSRITGKQLRLKESDRVHAMAMNLRSMGVKLKELPEGLEIEGGRLHGSTVKSFGDHRIVMAMSIAALGARGKSIILDTHVVDKSYPSFFQELRRLIV